MHQQSTTTITHRHSHDRYFPHPTLPSHDSHTNTTTTPKPHNEVVLVCILLQEGAPALNVAQPHQHPLLLAQPDAEVVALPAVLVGARQRGLAELQG